MEALRNLGGFHGLHGHSRRLIALEIKTRVWKFR